VPTHAYVIEVIAFNLSVIATCFRFDKNWFIYRIAESSRYWKINFNPEDFVQHLTEGELNEHKVYPFNCAPTQASPGAVRDPVHVIVGPQIHPFVNFA
jgi:hypothetical protein